MRHKDLGTIESSILIFGGPYSNLQATRAALSKAVEQDAFPVCTGDVVGYCARPRETVAEIRNAGCAVVAGNCELQLADSATTCGCGFEAGSTCDILSAGWFGFASETVGCTDRAWMAALPTLISFLHAGERYGVIHGGVDNVARFLWSTTEVVELDKQWDALEEKIGAVDHIVAGHSGIPFSRSLPRGRWINAGVIGMPPHDGRSATRYALLQNGAVSFHDLRYDVAGAVSDMRDAGLTQGYDTALQDGYWPSEDVLPPDLRRSFAKG